VAIAVSPKKSPCFGWLLSVQCIRTEQLRSTAETRKKTAKKIKAEGHNADPQIKAQPTKRKW
jgi:hypothetical protein